MQTDKHVAYFCMEYGLDQDLPLYAGGLGVLAGDYLKASHDAKAPVVGIGIRWWQDYTYQYINDEGRPYDTYPTHELDFLKDTGITVTVKIENKEVKCNVHKVENFGNAPLYLLDTGRPDTEFGWITDRLYGGGKIDRIAQEIVLGIGGIKVLRALNIDVAKYHFNEGHAAFAGFELIKEKMLNFNMSFEEALNETRKEIVFTTHTPVPAGNESHSLDLLQQMKADFGLTNEQLKKIGGDPLNMTAACLRMSQIANGVSELHGKTAQKMWKNLDNSAPIISITNGIHIDTWQNEKIKKSYNERYGLWQAHMETKKELVDYIYENTGVKMNHDNLIVGFARRAAPYKRSELIFRNTEEIEDLLLEGKLQLVFSGKAHPNDHYGKDIVATLVKMDQKYENSVVFLENYNLEIARYLCQGCDVWLNNPKRPLEASGTSGMKAAANGVLNLSVMDGWVAEGLEHGTSGWLLDELFDDFDETLGEDERDLKALYRIIKEEVIPTYYHDREKWLKMMYESIDMAYYDFSAARMLNEYFDKMYSRKSEQAALF